MLNNGIDCSYSVEDICKIYSLDKNKLLKYLRENNIIHSQRKIEINGTIKNNRNYNLPKKEYNHLFNLVKQKGKNGFINYKLNFTGKGKSFIEQAVSLKMI